MPQKSVPEEVREALLLNHPLMRVGKMAAEAGDWIMTKGEDLYRKGQKALTPKKARKDIYLPPQKGRSVRKR